MRDVKSQGPDVTAISAFAGQGVSRRRAISGALALGAVSGAKAHAAYNPEQDMIGELKYHVTDDRTTLLELAEFHDLGLLEISAINRGVDVWVPGADRLIVLPTAHLLPEASRRGIVVNLAELRLYHFDDYGGVFTHAIGIGRDGFSTPFGRTEIVRKRANPSWYPTAETRADNPELPNIVGPGPDNPLGRHAIYLGWPTYLIHGTNKPFGVGRRVSRGCIRMYPQSIAAVFSRARAGQPVEVVRQAIKLGWHNDEIYLEAHPDTHQLDELEATYNLTIKPAPNIQRRIIEKAGARATDIDWSLVELELVERRGIPIQITRRSGRRLFSFLPAELPGIY